ncbi:MAG: protein YgfX [Gammaproteobacteria bacterium]
MNAYQGTVCLALRRSRRLPRVLLALHLAGMALVAVYWPLTLASAAWLALLGAHGAWQWMRLRGAARWVRQIEIDTRGAWRLAYADGRRLDVRLTHAPLVLPWLVALEFRAADGRRHDLLLLPDMLDPDAFRRLRVRLTLAVGT